MAFVGKAPRILGAHGHSYHRCCLAQARWQLVARPAGSAAALTNTASLSAGLQSDIPGRYRVRFTGCPGGCTITHAGRAEAVGARSVELEIEVADEFAIPPEAEPFVPEQAATPPPPAAGAKCTFTGGSVLLPAWVTVNHWNGVEDYETVEGKVKGSKVSRKDSPMNHSIHDVNVGLVPDPQFNHLMTAGKKDLEIEWEWQKFPEVFRPTRNDRASVKGFWIYDCSHGDRTEIHPPVMSVAHRPRAVEVSPALGLGST